MQKALGREPEFVIFDGSGAAIPPVATRKRVLVAGAHQPPELVVGYLNAYRILVSDLVVLTMAEDGTRHQELAEAIREVKDVPVVATVLRPRPIEPVEGKRVAFFTTADSSATELLEGHLRDEHGAADVTISCNLSRREQLREDVQRADADVFVVEIKAAAIDVVAGPPPSGTSRWSSPTTTSFRSRAAGPGRRAAGARGDGAAGARALMPERRRFDPLHLGTDEHPYSKGLMARALMRTGLGVAGAYEVARRVEQDLAATGKRTADFDRMEELAIEVLGEPDGALAIGRLRRYQELDELDLPLIILIGGATGTGKSTVAAEVAYRLGITRVTSTDFVRQTMRALFTPEFLPAIHYSSFDAGRALPTAQEEEVDPLLHGFLEQTRHVLVGVQAAIDRSLEEGWSMVIEGVHLVPGMLPRMVENALVVDCVITIGNEETHAGHFWIRDIASEGVRPLDKYLERLGDIRYLQDYIVERAQGGCPGDREC